MAANKYLKTVVLIALFIAQASVACSMYKLTANGKTFVGNNEDSWGVGSQIWFEPAVPGKFGVAYVGYAGKNGPDGAYNEYGLVFDAFTMYHKANVPARDPNKEDFTYTRLKAIMQQCKTVKDVHDYLSKLNLNYLNGSPIFNGGMLLFVDKTGQYLVVEPNKMTLGADPKFLLANFSIADTKDLNTITTERYCKGVEFTKNGFEATPAFAAKLSQAMSVNRHKVGDGTLYTTIYDLNEGIIYAYFYHDFTKVKAFNLKEELAKGPHTYAFSALFPDNAAYTKFLAYKTPQNSRLLFIFIAFCILLFFFSMTYFGIGAIRQAIKRRPGAMAASLKAALSLLSLSMGIYAVILLRNQGIFYFDAPYTDTHSVLVTVSSYIPFLLLLVIVPLIIKNIRLLKAKAYGAFARVLLTLNSLSLVVLLGLFVYWGLFNVFN